MFVSVCVCVCVCRFCRLSHDGARPASVRDGDGPGLRSCSMDRAVSLTRGSTLYLQPGTERMGAILESAAHRIGHA